MRISGRALVEVCVVLPLVCSERLGKLVSELSPTINVEFGEQDE